MLNACNEKLVVHSHPYRAVTVNSKCKIGELRLVALSTNVALAKKGQSLPVGAFSCGTVFEHHVQGAIVAYVLPKFSMPLAGASASNHFVVPFWAVRSTADSEASNMVLENLKVELSVKMVGKASSDNVIEVPILKNKMPLHNGDELLFYKPVKAIAKQLGAPKRAEELEHSSAPAIKKPKGTAKGAGKGKR